MNDELAGQLRALGAGATLPQVQALYAPLLAQQPRAGVQCTVDEAYGAHARQRLDVYRPETARSLPLPVLVMLHGGGFIRGDKAQRANFGFWAARQGFIAVLLNYRLAPESRWPGGAEDAAAVCSWVRAHAERFAGDPARVILIGESAGAAHVAAASLCRCFQPHDWQLAAAVLLSGPYNARLEALARAQLGIATPDLRNDAYFGTDPAALAQASIIDHIDAPPFPLLIGFAERDLLQMQVQAGELFARLVTRHGFAPALHCWRDHNHFSPGYSFGTEDHSVSGTVLEFLRQHTAR
jgi:acetyl esterase/lipase